MSRICERGGETKLNYVTRGGKRLESLFFSDHHSTMASSFSKKRKREEVDSTKSVSFALSDQPLSQLGPVLGKKRTSLIVLARVDRSKHRFSSSSQLSCAWTFKTYTFPMLSTKKSSKWREKWTDVSFFICCRWNGIGRIFFIWRIPTGIRRGSVSDTSSRIWIPY